MSQAIKEKFGLKVGKIMREIKELERELAPDGKFKSLLKKYPQHSKSVLENMEVAHEYLHDAIGSLWSPREKRDMQKDLL